MWTATGAFSIAGRLGDVALVVVDAHALVVIGAAVGHRCARSVAGDDAERIGGCAWPDGDPPRRHRKRPRASGRRRRVPRCCWGDVFALDRGGGDDATVRTIE